MKNSTHPANMQVKKCVVSASTCAKKSFVDQLRLSKPLHCTRTKSLFNLVRRTCSILLQSYIFGLCHVDFSDLVAEKTEH